MSKVTMPEPVGYQWLDTGHFRKKIPKGCDVSAFRKLITVGQAEAYTADRVREALEEAAKVCDAYFKEIEEQSRSTYEEGKLDAADILEQRIKALIPSQTGDSNVATD